MTDAIIAASTGLLPSSAALPHLTDPDDWSGQLRLLACAGYSHVDLSDLWVPLGELDEPGIDHLLSALDATGMSTVGASVIGVELHEPSKRDASLAWIRSALINSARIGVNHVSIGLHPKAARQAVPGSRPAWVDAPGPTTHTDAQFTSVADDLRSLADHASDLGLTLSLEMHERTLVDTAAHSFRLLELIDRASVGLNPDLGNLIRPSWALTETWYETLTKIADHVSYWHIKNVLRIEVPGGTAISTFATLEAGTIDYRAAIAVLLDAGYAGPLVVEHYGGDAIGFAASSHRYLSGLLSSDLGVTPTG